MKDYEMSLLYHPKKSNMIVDALSIIYMGSVAHVVDSTKELLKEVHRLAQLGI